MHQTTDVIAIPDRFPVSMGHTLVIPKRHIESIFDATESELKQFCETIKFAVDKIRLELKPVAFNMGVNEGVGAGQTVSHAHIHIIPRYENDVEDPRGGIRWVVPAKAVYWSDA